MNQSFLLALGILSSSFLGSWHCGLMCSPIATLMKSRNSLIAYHLGRLLSYVALGVLAGAIGNFFLDHSFAVLRKLSAVVLTLTLFYSAVSLLLPQKFRGFGPLSAKLHLWINRTSAPLGPWLERSGLLVGLLTSLLPCGWLYTYVAAALATKSPVAGGLVLFLFWLGGLPALSTIPLAMSSLIKAAPQKRRHVAGYVLLAASIYSVGMFFV